VHFEALGMGRGLFHAFDQLVAKFAHFTPD
jgi:hypothetical protein